MHITDKIGEATALLNEVVMEKHGIKVETAEQSKKTARRVKSTKYNIYEDGKVVATTDDAKSERSRRFNIRTYISPETLHKFLRTCSWLQCWAYCVHDKDRDTDGNLKQKHTHVLLYTYSAKTASAIEKNFDRLDAQTRAENAKPESTHVEIMRDTTASWRYLIHADDPDKYQYPDSERIANDKSWWVKYECTDGLNDVANNTGLAMLEDRMSGMSTYDMTVKYGKEWLYHKKHIEDACYSVQVEQGKVDALPFDARLLNVMLDASGFRKEDVAIFKTILSYLQRECMATYNSTIDLYLKEDIKKNA